MENSRLPKQIIYRRPQGNGATAAPAEKGGDSFPEPEQPEPAETASAGNPPRRAWVKPLVILVVVALFLAGAAWAFRAWSWSRTHVSTDDAFVSGSLVNVSPSISGTLLQLTAREGDPVRQGQLLARLDDAGPRAALRQAQANYQAALSQIPQAERNLRFQERATEAAIRRAQAAQAAQKSQTNAARQQVDLTRNTVENQVRQAESQVRAAQAQAEQSKALINTWVAQREGYRQGITTAQAALSNFQQQVVTSQKAAQAAQARVNAAAADSDRATRDEERYRYLLGEKAASQQAYDLARAQARNARAQLDAAKEEAEQATSQVEQARRSVTQAQSQVEQAREMVEQAQAQIDAAKQAAAAAQEQVGVAQAGRRLAQGNTGQVGVQQSNLQSTVQQGGEAAAEVSTAEAGQEQIELRRKQIDTYRAQAEQARAALANAQITLNDTYIYAPHDGTVVRKSASVGTSLSPGQTMVTITEGDYVWVTANFKETQLRNVVPGEPAEVEADAFGGKIYRGRVRSINEATGAATSLLPADNATGNFTKVVQRVPVRIELIAADEHDDRKYARAEDIHNLRQGMSVVATIDTGEHRDRSRSLLERDGARETGSGTVSPSPAASGENASGGTGPVEPAGDGVTGGSAGSQSRGSSSDGGGGNGGSVPGTGAADIGGQTVPPAAVTPGSIPNLGAGSLNPTGRFGVPSPGPGSLPNGGVAMPTAPTGPGVPGRANGGTSIPGSDGTGVGSRGLPTPSTTTGAPSTDPGVGNPGSGRTGMPGASAGRGRAGTGGEIGTGMGVGGTGIGAGGTGR